VEQEYLNDIKASEMDIVCLIDEEKFLLGPLKYLHACT